jgi:uncharacterized phiE125 gp8 family phage protein
MQEAEWTEKVIHSLIPLEDFKALMGIDDRDDKMSRFCLTTATYTIEHYCSRRLCSSTINQVFREWPDYTVNLSEYPVLDILTVFALYRDKESEIIKPDFYRTEPTWENENIPYSLIFFPAIRSLRGIKFIKVIYSSGYTAGEAPADLASACLELAAWNMNRYKGKRIGVKETEGKDLLELSIPLNVRQLIEPYKRRMI